MNIPFCKTSIEFISEDDIPCLPETLTGRKVLFLATQSALERFSLENLLDTLYMECETLWYAGCAPNPEPRDICNGLAYMGDFAPDCIIALGGGSVIDFAKAVAALGYLAEEAEPSAETIIDAIRSKEYQKNKEYPDIIAVPTTAGTGSELTQWSTIWDMNNQHKYSIDTLGLKPKRALMCPELTYSMPKRLTLVSGLDSVSHALEAYWAKRTTPLVQELSKQSLTLSVKHLKSALETPNDRIAREYVFRASILSGLAFSQTRTAACHSISYPLTCHFDIEHGLAAAVTLAEVFQKNRQALRFSSEVDEIFSDYCGIQGWLDYVCDGIIWLRLSSFGVGAHDLEILAAQSFTAGRMDNNPVDFSRWDVLRILEAVL